MSRPASLTMQPLGAQRVNSITRVRLCVPIAPLQALLSPSHPIWVAPAHVDSQESLTESRPDGVTARPRQTAGPGNCLSSL